MAAQKGKDLLIKLGKIGMETLEGITDSIEKRLIGLSVK